LRIATEEGEEEKESFIGFADYVALFECFNGGVFHVGVDVDVERFRTEGHTSEIFDFGGLGG
jgi:hypothetical protein